EVPLDEATSLVGVAGTVTTVTAVATGIQDYRPEVTHAASLTLDEVRDTCRTLLAETRAERSLRTVIHPGRIDVIGAGALIWSRIVSRVSAAGGIDSARTSEHDILDGIALDLLDRVP